MDSEFGTLLMKEINKRLHGDGAVPGLYSAIRSCKTFDAYKEMCGKMTALEEVIEIMTEVAKKMNMRRQ